MSLPIRQNIKNMQPYSPGKPMDEVKRELGLTEVIKLASNENPLGPSPKAKSAIADAIESLHLYPDAAAFDLKKAIAERFGIDSDCVMLGNGSDELIHYLGLVFLGKAEDEVIVADPSFVRYDAVAQIADCKIVKVKVNSDYQIELKNIRSAITSNTRMIFLANPNNPTGAIFGRAEFEEFLAGLPEGIVVILDEAYFEYATHDPSYPDGLVYLKGGAEVVVLRTMSKAYGLAGLRLGFGFASAEIVDAINRVRAPFNTSSLAQVAAVAALADVEHLENVRKANASEMARVTHALKKAGGRPVPSFANFVLAEFDFPTRPIFDGLLKQGVIVRGGHQLGLPNTLRVSIGTKEEVDLFITTLAEVIEDLKVK